MKRLVALLATALLAASFILPTAAFAGNRPDLADLVAAEVKAERDSYCGSPNIDRSSARDNVTAWRAQDRVANGGYDHEDPDGKFIWDYFDSFGVKDDTGAGEIVGVSTYSDTEFAAHMMVAWLNSPTHEAVIHTCSYDSFGAGVWKEANGTKWVNVVFTNQPVRYANNPGGTIGIYSAAAAACGSTKLGDIPDNGRLIQYDHKTSTCDGVLWYFVRWTPGPLTGWVKSTKVTNSP